MRYSCNDIKKNTISQLKLTLQENSDHHATMKLAEKGKTE